MIEYNVFWAAGAQLETLGNNNNLNNNLTEE